MSEQETRAREWWPLDWADEAMPPSRATPDGFLINANGHFWLGYAFDAADASEQDKRYFSRALSSGDIVAFICCDDLGEVPIAINPDGGYRVHGAVPAECTHFWIKGDTDSLMHSLDALVAAYVENEMSVGFTAQAEETLHLARWSDGIPFKFEVSYDLSPAARGVVGRFVTVSAAEGRQ